MRTKLREMTPADVPAVLEKLREQNERDGTSYAMPRVFGLDGQRLPSVPLALVSVDVKTGAVVQGHVWERTVEQMSFGIAPEATACSMREHAAVYMLLQQHGYHDVHILVPTERVAQMEHELDRVLGAVKTDGYLSHFYRLLDPAANERLRQWRDAQENEGNEE